MAIDVDTRRLKTDILLPVDPEESVPVTPSGDLQILSGRPNLKYAVRRRLLTMPSELIHRPDYGAGVPGYIEQIGNLSTKSRLANEAQANLMRDERLSKVRVAVTDGSPKDPNRKAAITLDVTIEVERDKAEELLTISFSD